MKKLHIFLKIPGVGIWLNKSWFTQTLKYRGALKLDAMNVYGHEEIFNNMTSRKISHGPIC